VKIIVLDTEASGSEKEDRVISLAVGEIEKERLIRLKTGLFNPGVLVKEGAFWVHKLSNELLADKPDFQTTEFLQYLACFFSDYHNIVVGHAICNDLFLLAKENLFCQCQVIDTQFCAQKVLKTEKSSLNYLAKEYNLLGDNEKIKFHTAEDDVKVTFLLFNELLKHNSLKELIDMSMEPFYEISVKVSKYQKQRIYHLAAQDKERLCEYFLVTRDPKAMYALMYFYYNAELFRNETKKALIRKVLNA